MRVVGEVMTAIVLLGVALLALLGISMLVGWVTYRLLLFAGLDVMSSAGTGCVAGAIVLVGVVGIYQLAMRSIEQG